MKKLSIFFCFFLFGFLSFAQDDVLVIKNVSVIDIKNDKILNGRNVAIKGNRITGISKRSHISKEATVIDGSGKFLIPGLWDMHTHSLSNTDSRHQWFFPLLIANGITGMRVLGSLNLSFEQINQLRKDVEAGRLLGPRFGAVTQKVIEGPGTGIPNFSTVVTTTDEARQLVRTFKQQGMDFVKVYDRLSRDVYLAIVDEAKRQALPVAGHVPLSMTGAEVSDLGQISIEHVNNDILVSCSRDEVELRKELQERLKSSQQEAFAPVLAKAVEKYDEQKAQNFFARIRKNGTWLCPTLALHRPTELVGDESKLLTDSRLKYMPASWRERWRQSQQRSSQVATLAERKLVFDTRLKIVGVMHRTGIRLLAGADAPGPYTVPGFSLHEELETLVQAGLSPIEALRTATLNPAMFFGKEKEWGTVEKGKVADLVLLDANPLDVISNTQKIFAVIVNGKLLQRSDLDNLFRLVEVQAQK
jgi:hypothetical protein